MLKLPTPTTVIPREKAVSLSWYLVILYLLWCVHFCYIKSYVIYHIIWICWRVFHP